MAIRRAAPTVRQLSRRRVTWRTRRSSSRWRTSAPARVALAGGRPKSWRSTRPEAVRFGGDHVQAAQFGDAAGELDVGAAAGHVGGDGDLAALAGLGDDRRFLGRLRRVEHAMRPARRCQTAG